MRLIPLPWASLSFLVIALLLLWLDGVGPVMLLVTAALALCAMVGVWWWASDGQHPADQGPIASEPADAPAALRNALMAAAEGSSLPMLIADRSRILGANAPARAALGAHVVGQDPRIALRHPDAIKLLDSGEEGMASVTVSGLTGTGTLWQLSRTMVADGLWIIEARDRSAEADISRAHTDFVANASHELRTPLSSIIGYVETLAETPAMEPALTKRFLGTVLREARRMQGLLADLMSLSQLEAEKHDVPTAQIDLVGLAARVVGEFAPAPGKPSRVEWARPEGEMAITGDQKQLEQLLRNLIDNALKYGDADQPVTVVLATTPRAMAELTVQDRGPGIAPDHLPHLTRRFYRTDPGRSRAAGGTGLGLAIVKHIVERHRGRLDIASTLGQGTTVSVRLPLASAKADNKS